MGESARWAGAPRTMTPASYASPGVASSVNGHRAAGCGQLLEGDHLQAQHAAQRKEVTQVRLVGHIVWAANGGQELLTSTFAADRIGGTCDPCQDDRSLWLFDSRTSRSSAS